MPELKTKQISADEAMDVLKKRGEVTKDTDKGVAVMKAVRGGSWDKESRTCRYVMTTQQIDRYGDVVVTDGVDIAEFLKNPVAPFCHNTRTWQIGNWSNLEKQLKGRPPRMEGDMTLMPADGPIPLIAEAEWMLNNGGLRACSIGFVVDWKEAEMILDEDGKPTWGLKFNKSELLECSPCIVPANPGALMKMVNGDLPLAKEIVEDILDNYAKTPEGVLIPRKDFEATYRTIVEKIQAEAVAPTKDAAVAAVEATAAETAAPIVTIENATDCEVKHEVGADGVIKVFVAAKQAAKTDEPPVLETKLKISGIDEIAADVAPVLRELSGAVVRQRSLIEKFYDALKFNSSKAEEPPPPSPEVVAEARARAAAIHERLAQKAAA